MWRTNFAVETTDIHASVRARALYCTWLMSTADATVQAITASSGQKYAGDEPERTES